jgi:hypothetical protein
MERVLAQDYSPLLPGVVRPPGRPPQAQLSAIREWPGGIGRAIGSWLLVAEAPEGAPKNNLTEAILGSGASPSPPGRRSRPEFTRRQYCVATENRLRKSCSRCIKIPEVLEPPRIHGGSLWRLALESRSSTMEERNDLTRRQRLRQQDRWSSRTVSSRVAQSFGLSLRPN